MMSFMYYGIIFFSVILLILLLLAEIRRINKAHLFWRLLGSFIAVTSLVLLIIPISYKVPTVKNNSISIFTEGTNLDSVPKALKNGYPIQSIPDLSYFLRSKPEIESINIFGYGLKPSDLEQVSRYPLHFYPTKPKGIISVQWNTRLLYTKPLLLQGTYVNPVLNEVKLVLRGFGTNLDSMLVPAGKMAKFSLSCIPKQSGKAIFELLAFSQEKELSREQVPIEVAEPKPLNVLLMSSNPDFEYKFLKNWLYEEGHSIMHRSRISKSALSFDFLNVEPLNLNSINGNLLKKVDVLICDETELAVMSSQESRQIEQAVSQGMGLFVRITDLPQPSSPNLTRQFMRYELPDTSDKVEQKLFLKSSSTSLVLSKDKSGRILAESSLHGRGKVAGSVLLGTYKWLLEGKASTYQSYWSDRISELSRKTLNKTRFEISPQIPVAAERIRIAVSQLKTDVPTIKLNGEMLAPRQNLVTPLEWDVESFPMDHGWNSLGINGEQNFFFVHGERSWEDLRHNNTSLATRFVSHVDNSAGSAQGTSVKLEKTVPEWIFFVLFLFSAGFLWLEPKLLLRNQQ
jgi:hypothetical protein